MKTQIFSLCLLVASGQCAFAADFARDGGIGEGIPHFAATRSSLQVYREPATTSVQSTITVKAKREIRYDQSRVITKKPVILTTKVATRLDCENKTLDLKPHESIEYMSYLGEGAIEVRYKGMVCQTSEGDKVFKGLDQQPIVEWWIRVIDANKKPLGWLLIEDHDKSQVKELDRTF